MIDATTGRRVLPHAAVILSACLCMGQVKDVKHPFLLWTAQEAADIAKRIQADPQAKKQYEQMVALETGGKGTNKSLLNLFKFSVLNDKAAGETEKKTLLKFIGARPPGSEAGNPATANAPWRDDRTLDALRFDVLYNELTAEERKGVLDTIRFYVKWHVDNPGPWRNAARTGWLPNMQWPTAAGIHVLAAASGDEAIIRQVFESSGGWKWFFDNYLADGRFYMEEFGKYYSNIGSMVLWCQGLERLGLDKYGWSYVGKGGASMRNFLEMLVWAGYPRVARQGGTPDYPTVNMGDAGPLYVVSGYLPDGKGGTPWWRQAMMNGPIPKMAQPMWWEAAHKKFPDAGFDYFLAQLRKPGEETCLPSLYFGMGPIDAKKVKPPGVKSYVAPERGFAMLRAEESPAYWESPKPAVALQFGMYYVHYVHDCFSILQYVAHNRFIYNKIGAAGQGYAGGDPWRDHVRGQGSGVVVDGLKAQFVDNGEEGTKNERVRHHFCPPAKFVAVQAKGIYPDVDQERALVLTADYLLDVFRLTSDRARVYDWHVLSPARVHGIDAEPWKPLGAIEGGKLGDRDLNKPQLSDTRFREVGGKPWTVALLQQRPDGDPTDGNVVGVNVSMWGHDGTVLVAGRPPGVAATDLGVSLKATRTAPSALFVALHEPFKGGLGARRVASFTAVAEDASGLVAAVVGKDGSGIGDRVVVRVGTEPGKPATLAGQGESFTVADFAWIRLGTDKVEAWGGLTAMKVKVSGSPKLVLNGKEVPAAVVGGELTFRAGP